MIIKTYRNGVIVGKDNDAVAIDIQPGVLTGYDVLHIYVNHGCEAEIINPHHITIRRPYADHTKKKRQPHD